MAFVTREVCGVAADMKALAEVFDKLRAAATDLFHLSLADYADVFAELIADPPVRPPFDPLARIRILGPLEARLQSVDRVIIGGLNEGTWPLGTQQLDMTSVTSVGITDGSAAYLRFGVAANAIGGGRITARGTAVPAGFALSILRTK